MRLYASVTGTLPQYLNVTVTRGSGAAGFDNCTGFTADAGDYGYGPGGVVYSGTLQAFPSTYAAGITWTDGESMRIASMSC